MMTISEKNIIKRWSDMASVDLGYNVNPVASEFLQLFKKVFENEETQFSGVEFGNIKKYLRGFAINNQGRFGQCSVVECLNLDYINIDKEALQELDYQLMTTDHYDRKWYDVYRYAREEIEKASKPKKKRK